MVFSREERERAVELYFSAPMSAKQVVEHLGVSDQTVSGYGGCMTVPGYADAVPKLPIPLGTRCRAVELCLSGMQRKRAATELGAGAVHHWTGPCRADGMVSPGIGTEGRHTHRVESVTSRWRWPGCVVLSDTRAGGGGVDAGGGSGA